MAHFISVHLHAHPRDRTEVANIATGVNPGTSLSKTALCLHFTTHYRSAADARRQRYAHFVRGPPPGIYGWPLFRGGALPLGMGMRLLFSDGASAHPPQRRLLAFAFAFSFPGVWPPPDERCYALGSRVGGSNSIPEFCARKRGRAPERAKP